MSTSTLSRDAFEAWADETFQTLAGVSQSAPNSRLTKLLKVEANHAGFFRVTLGSETLYEGTDRSRALAAATPAISSVLDIDNALSNNWVEFASGTVPRRPGSSLMDRKIMRVNGNREFHVTLGSKTLYQGGDLDCAIDAFNAAQ